MKKRWPTSKVICLKEERRKRTAVIEQYQELAHDTRTRFAEVTGVNLLQLVAQIACGLEFMSLEQMYSMPTIMAGLASLTNIALLVFQVGNVEGQFKGLRRTIALGGPYKQDSQAQDLAPNTIFDHLSGPSGMVVQHLLSTVPSVIIMYHASKTTEATTTQQLLLQAIAFCTVLGLKIRGSQVEIRDHIKETIDNMAESAAFQAEWRKQAN